MRHLLPRWRRPDPGHAWADSDNGAVSASPARVGRSEIDPGAGRARDLLLVAQEWSAGVVATPEGIAGVPTAVAPAFLEEYYRDAEGDSHRDTEFLTMIQLLTSAAVTPLSNAVT